MSTRPSGASTTASDAAKEFAADVEYYLTQEPRQLPSRYFYDALGSALFDAICELPWYRITRAELALLRRHRRAIFATLPGLSRIVELGPGNGAKLMALVGAGGSRSRLDLHLVDVSSWALERSRRALASLDNVDVSTCEAAYEAGLAEVMRAAGRGGPTLVAFLGSNIGNFDRPGADAFLRGIRAALASGDALLLGADLVKRERELLLAYDDPLGVTAAFNRNLLVRINRELAGEVDLDGFAHRAIWNAGASRVEMHLVSRRRQRVRVAASGIDITLDEGDTIWTESSYKYRPEELTPTLERAGFRRVDQWTSDDGGFALALVKAG